MSSIVSKRSSTPCAVWLTGLSARVAATITAPAPNTSRALRPRDATTWAMPPAMSATQAERTEVSASADEREHRARHDDRARALQA